MARKFISSKQCPKGSLIIYATLSSIQSYPLSSLTLILHLTLLHSLHFSSHCVPGNTALTSSPRLTFPLNSDLFGPVGCTCKRLGIGDRILDISSPAISLFWHYASRGGCFQTTNVLTRAATSPWFHLLPLKGLGLKWVPSLCSH